MPPPDDPGAFRVEPHQHHPSGEKTQLDTMTCCVADRMPTNGYAGERFPEQRFLSGFSG